MDLATAFVIAASAAENSSPSPQSIQLQVSLEAVDGDAGNIFKDGGAGLPSQLSYKPAVFAVKRPGQKEFWKTPPQFSGDVIVAQKPGASWEVTFLPNELYTEFRAIVKDNNTNETIKFAWSVSETVAFVGTPLLQFIENGAASKASTALISLQYQPSGAEFNSQSTILTSALTITYL